MEDKGDLRGLQELSTGPAREVLGSGYCRGNGKLTLAQNILGKRPKLGNSALRDFCYALYFNSLVTNKTNFRTCTEPPFGQVCSGLYGVHPAGIPQ